MLITLQYPSTASSISANSSKSDNKIAYLTFDDGPSGNNTPVNLDTLKKYDVKATFFVLPKSNLDDVYKRILKEGHVLGNHSYSHDYKYLYSSADKFKTDILKAKSFIYTKFGYTTTVFRFPGGTMGRKKSLVNRYSAILSKEGYKYFDWNVSTADTDPNLRKYGNDEYITNLLANNVIKNSKNKNKLIVLMHDSSDKIYTAKALPKIIEGLKKQGYRFDVLTNY
jgi:peptidoglycan/xylan/chitin deacetylase (PgdA/CDA1 family)